MMYPVSVIILTFNEEQNLPACLDSLTAFDDVHVLDCGSTDSTQAIAQSRSIPVHVNPFKGFGTQRNWAIDQIPTKYEWQFHLDADERMTPELAEELRKLIATDPKVGGCQVPSKLMFAGQWLKRAGQYPGYQVRFFHKARLRFEDYGHGQREISDNPIGFLKSPMIHYGFSKGIDHWFTKHIGYAKREAERAVSGSTGGKLFSRDSVQRRRAIKRWTSKLPGRYFLRLSYMLFVKGALLDGWAGITYAHMLATYDGMIDVYLRFHRRGIDVNKGV